MKLFNSGRSVARIAELCLIFFLLATGAGAQDFFAVRSIRLGRLKLENLHIRQATVSAGEGEQGEYKQPVRLVFDSGRMTLLSADQTKVMLSGKLFGGSSLSAIFTCSGGPCVAPRELSFGPDGLKLTATVDTSEIPALLGSGASLMGAQI